jgi:hypothetical protein
MESHLDDYMSQSIGLNKNEGISYKNIYNTTRDLMFDTFNADGDWNDETDYTEKDAEWEYIQKFLAMKGEDAEYVKQKDGKIVIKVGDKEQSFT